MASKKNNEDQLWQDIIQEYADKKNCVEVKEPDFTTIDLMTPEEIVTKLDESVIGQQSAKELLSTAIWNRLLALNNRGMKRNKDDYYFEKNNILLVGNTGSGKTHLIRTLCNSVHLPVVIDDATTFTEAGYVGRDVSECVEALANEAELVVDKLCETTGISITGTKRRDLVETLTEHGIIYIDEADKIASSTPGPGKKDVSGRSVQEAFLKLVEGTGVEIRTRNSKGMINTDNILFVFGGAFSSLVPMVKQRLNKRSIGFTAEVTEDVANEIVLKDALISDFIIFGMIPELMGRLSTVAVLDPLTPDMIFQIFTEPKHSILSQVINEFKSYGVTASFTDEAIELISTESTKLNLGARGLKSIAQQLLRPLLYKLPSVKQKINIVITREMLLELQEKGLGNVS